MSQLNNEFRRTLCPPQLVKKVIYYRKNGLSGDSPQCGEMSRSDKGEGHVLSAPAPTICLLFVKSFVGDGVLDVPKLVFRQPAADHVSAFFTQKNKPRIYSRPVVLICRRRAVNCCECLFFGIIRFFCSYSLVRGRISFRG